MSDLVEKLRDWAQDPVGRNPAKAPCAEAAAEIERLRAETARLANLASAQAQDIVALGQMAGQSAAHEVQIAALREALLAVTYAAHELCAALDIDLDETVIRGKNFLTDEVVAQKSLADIFAQVAAALEEK